MTKPARLWIEICVIMHLTQDNAVVPSWLMACNAFACNAFRVSDGLVQLALDSLSEIRSITSESERFRNVARQSPLRLERFMTDTDSLNLIHLMDKFQTDEKCRDYLEALRWPDGKVECPHCGCDNVSELRSRPQWDCAACRYQFSVTAGTIMHDSHLPLRKWLIAIYLMLESKKAISANQMKRRWGSAPTARLGTSAIAFARRWETTRSRVLPWSES